MSDARTQRPFLAAAWMLGALLCLCGMAIAGREMSVELNPFQMALLQSPAAWLSLRDPQREVEA